MIGYAACPFLLKDIRTRAWVPLASWKETMKRTSRTSGEQIIAQAEARAKVLGVKFLGCTVLLLALSGIAAFFVNPSGAKDVWVFIGPILTAAISGMIGFWAGSRRRQA